MPTAQGLGPEQFTIRVEYSFCCNTTEFSKYEHNVICVKLSTSAQYGVIAFVASQTLPYCTLKIKEHITESSGPTQQNNLPTNNRIGISTVGNIINK